MIADVAVESFLTDIFSTTDLTIDLRSLDTELEISSDAEELKEILFALSTLSIYPSIKLLVSINSDKLMTPGSNVKLLTLYMGLKNFDSFPILNYRKKNSKFYFWSTGYPLLRHHKKSDTTIIELLKSQKDSLIYAVKKNQSKV